MSDVGTDAVARPGAGADPGAGPMVEASGLGRTYRGGGRTVHALRDVDLSVAAGELVAVRGRSGAGKTTLLNLVGGLDRPDHGKVVVAGRDVAALDEAGLVRLRREVVGFVFQTFGLIPVLTAAENVGMALRLTGAPAAEREERVRLLLALVGLDGQARQRPQELSGGQQQRVAIARALANKPRLLIADEPTAQLDSETGRSIMELIRSAVRSEGATAIVATHDATLLGVADRVLTLHDGRLVPPEDRPSP